jgi:homoserine kinase
VSGAGRPDAPGASVGVTVPASSANLGPGFDALAVALDVAREARTAPRGEPRVVTRGHGAGVLPRVESILVWRGLAACCEHVGAPVPDCSLVVDNAIPLERGLGSSAAAAVAGLALGRALAGASFDDRELVRLAAALEGHPDNAAAAVLGGLVLCRAERISRVEPTDRLRPVLCVPAVRQSTAAARALLPDAVPLADAAANGARTAAVLAGLSGLVPLDVGAMTDVLHEPARFRAMPATGRLLEALRAEGVPACLSGAGPSVLGVVPAGSDRHVDQVRGLAGGDWEVIAAGWDRAGAVVCRP